MNQDESQSPTIPAMMPSQTPDNSPAPNQLQGMMRGGGSMYQAPPKTNITRNQLIAGLHHFNEVQKKLFGVLNSADAGKSNIRPKIFDASAALIGEGMMTVPEVMNGIKDLPEEPVAQKKWVEQKIGQMEMAKQKLVMDFVGQGPGGDTGNEAEWSPDNHRDHLTGLLGNYNAR